MHITEMKYLFPLHKIFMYYIPYNKSLKEFSRDLRKNSTLGEVLLWRELRAGKINGYTFNRQKPIDNYIVDFYCKPLNLVIEVDGISHFFEENAVKDAEKQKIIESLGLELIRVTEKEVRFSRKRVLQAIVTKVEEMEEKLGIEKGRVIHKHPPC